MSDHIVKELDRTIEDMRTALRKLPYLIIQLNGSGPDAQAKTVRALLKSHKALFRYPSWNADVVKKGLTPFEEEPMPYTMEPENRARLKAALQEIDEVLSAELRTLEA